MNFVLRGGGGGERGGGTADILSQCKNATNVIQSSNPINPSASRSSLRGKHPTSRNRSTKSAKIMRF